MPTSRKCLELLAVVVLTAAGAVVTNGQTSKPASNSKTQAKTTTNPSSSPKNTSQKPATGERCGNFGDGMGYMCYPAATSTTPVGNSPTVRTFGSYQLPNINWGALSSTRISPSDLAQTCQDNLSRIRGQVDASSLNAYQVSCDLGAKCLPQCSGLGSNEAVSSCLDRCFAFDDTNNATASFSSELKQRVVMDVLLNGTSAASHSAAVIDPSAFAQAGSDPVDQNMQDLLNDNAAATISADNNAAQQVIPDQSDVYNPQDAQNLLEEGLSQTTAGQVVTDIQDLGSGDGQKQLNGTFDLADKGNDKFNSNTASKYVVEKTLPRLHNVYSNAMNVVDAAAQDMHCATDPNCSFSFAASATGKQLNQVFTHPFSPPANENIFDQ